MKNRFYRSYHSHKSYHKKNSFNTSSYVKLNYFYKHKDIDFTNEELDYPHFLLQEFFNVTTEIKQKIFDFYASQYGNQSLSYLNRKYTEWKNGDYHLTELIRNRILNLMPQFLSNEAKNKLGLNDFMISIKNTIKLYLTSQKNSYKNITNLKNAQQLEEIFEKELQKIEHLNIVKPKFGILTEEDEQEMLGITQYILKTKLQMQFDQIEKDFNTFLPFFSHFKYGIFFTSYFIESFNLSIVLNADFDVVKLPKFTINDILINSQFKTYVDKYLAYELINFHLEKNKAISNAFLNSYDFFDHYRTLSLGENKVSIKSIFQGEGGVLSIQIDLIPLKILRLSLLFVVLRVLVYTFIGFVSVKLVVNYNLSFMPMLIFCGVISYGLFKNEIQQVRNLIKEIKKYGE